MTDSVLRAKQNTYVTPFLNLKADEKLKINGLIKKTFKQAIGLPFSTANDRFEALGLHNTLDGWVEAQRTAHYERLSQSETGTHILRSLGIAYETQAGPKDEIPPEWLAHLYVQT